MSILCLICKEKLLSYSHQGGPDGSLNQLVENVVIATGCGHLYHLECLQSWFRTQNIKQNNIDTDNNICPSCLLRVKEEDNRRIHLFEDHVEALERAKMLERQENLEIYCHQLEIQLQQLHRENDIMVNKILTPPGTPSENYDTIVKNDRVQWIRKDEPSISGIVLSIFKKEGKLCAKIRLDRKIRTTQRSNGIFSSFRSEKKQEVTVPFDEIVLEKDVNENNAAVGRGQNGSQQSLHAPLTNMNMSAYGKSLSSTNIFPMFTSPIGNFRNSTLSLPDESKRLFGIQESINESSTSINMEQPNYPLMTPPSKPSLNRSFSYSPGYTAIHSSNKNVTNAGNGQVLSPKPRESIPNQSATSSDASLDQQREYIVITPPWMRNKQQVTQAETKNSPPDNKNKHVTFADDHTQTRFPFEVPKVPESRESLSSINSDTPYANFPSPLSSNGNVTSSNSREQVTPLTTSPPPQPLPRPKVTIPQSLDQSLVFPTTQEKSNSCTDSNSSPTTPTPPPYDSKRASAFKPKVNEREASFSDDFSAFLEDFDDDDHSGDSDCFGVTLLSLLYCQNGFDQQMLVDNSQDNDFCRTVKWIIREKFICPLRQFNVVQPNYSLLLRESLAHLCSGTLDVEELLTILFEFTYKMSPFINYSLDMCDYLHQFFIDFTDKSKIRSVRELFEKSLFLQDNLKMEDTPYPALILQMPHSEDGIIHYDALIPNLTMVVDHLLEKDDRRTPKTCYCDNEATLECKICSDIHGADAVLFCEKCKDLLKGIHKTNDHELEVSQIPAFQILSATLNLSAIICWKNGRYYVFLKDGKETYSPWLYVHAIYNGKFQMKQLPGFGYWLDSLLDEHKTLNVQELPSLLQKVLKYPRVFFYIPVKTSEV